MNIITIEKGKVSITINGPVTIDKVIYSNLIFIGRLLSVEELSRVDSFSSENPESNIVIEDSVFDLAIESIVGFNDSILQEIDKDDMEAGIVATISLAIISKSYQYFFQAEKILETLAQEINLIDLMIVVVSRYTSTPYDDVRRLPINELMKRFAAIQKAFPREVQLVKNEE